MVIEDLESIIESILFVSGEPVKTARMAAVLGVGEPEIEAAANKMGDRYSFERRGIRLVKIDESFQLCSSPEFADYIRLALETRKNPQLSPPALEVLSVIAYFQPVTRAYVEQIRGVESSYTIGTLLDRGLIESCGRLAVPGRPMLYRTTHVFLRTFGLESLKELPELPHVEPSDDGRVGIQNAILELKERQEAASGAKDDAEPDSETGPEPAAVTEQDAIAEPESNVKPEDSAEPGIQIEPDDSPEPGDQAESHAPVESDAPAEPEDSAEPEESNAIDAPFPEDLQS